MDDFLDGRFYHDHSSQQKDWAFVFLRDYPFEGSEHILDIGCGDGKISAYIAKMVPEGDVVALDPSKNMIEFARKCFSNISNLRFENYKIEELSFSEKFDLIVSFSAFHWVKEQEQALKKILDGMKFGATLRMLFSFQIDYAISIAYRGVYNAYLENESHSYYGKTKEEYEKLLPTIGFSEWQLSIYEPEVVYKSREELIDWIYAWAPSILELEPKQYRAYSEDIARHICDVQGFQHSDGSISFPYPLLQLMAKK